MKHNLGLGGRIIWLLPTWGMGVFILLYILAAFSYPGGSYANPTHDAFSFWNNYLCDLLDTYTIGGHLNSARLFARLGLLVLCVSLSFLWYLMPKLFATKSNNQRVMQISGIASLLLTLFLSDNNHDVVVRIAGVFGVIALISLFVELHKAKHKALLWFGICCLAIFFINYYIYETGIYITSLPVIQKITFLGFITWFLLLNVLIYRKQTERTRP